MFFEKIPYGVLTITETSILIAFVAIMLLASLKEEKTWLLLTYTILGFILTVVSVLQIAIEVVNGNEAYHTSILMAIIAALCTTVWAVLYGIKRRGFRRNRKITTEEDE